MNGPIVSSIFPNTVMKQSILFFLILAANRGTCEPKRMNGTGEDIYCKYVSDPWRALPWQTRTS